MLSLILAHWPIEATQAHRIHVFAPTWRADGTLRQAPTRGEGALNCRVSLTKANESLRSCRSMRWCDELSASGVQDAAWPVAHPDHRRTPRGLRYTRCTDRYIYDRYIYDRYIYDRYICDRYIYDRYIYEDRYICDTSIALQLDVKRICVIWAGASAHHCGA